MHEGRLNAVKLSGEVNETLKFYFHRLPLECSPAHLFYQRLIFYAQEEDSESIVLSGGLTFIQRLRLMV